MKIVIIDYGIVMLEALLMLLVIKDMNQFYLMIVKLF